jgi:RNA polymerase sigma-70 factor, ECF subfamily
MAVRRPVPKVLQIDADERLLVEAAQRDLTKFADLYEAHFAKIYAFLAHRTGNRNAAEDLTSEVFHKALANLPSFQWRGVPFNAWLMRIAVNALSDHFKRAAREAPPNEDRPEPASKAEQESLENRARLFHLVDQLPADQRTVVFGRFVEQRSIREIAQQLGRSEGAVKQLQLRALQKLRLQMEGARA